MFKKLYKKLYLKLIRQPVLLSDMAEESMFYMRYTSSAEQKNIDTLFARVFNSEDGKKIISYLQYITFHRALNSTASDEQLRFHEGQRALMASILRIIERGRRA